MANLSKLKRERMLEFLNKLRGEHKDDDTIIAINEIESELTSKKYGLVWEEHEERVDDEIKTKVPVFTEVTDKEIIEDDDLPINFLLEGDNLHSLNLLEKTHKGRVDFIYIDPPYNTGSKDFVYNDEYVNTEDDFRHSKWLSFMSRRLEIAYRLLSDEGVLFISIDDNEQAQLKILCDEMFGYDNFVVTLPRITKKSGKTTNSFSKNHDYVHVYVKGSQNVFEMENHVDDAFKYTDEYVNERGTYKLNQTLDYDSLSYSSSLDYPLEIEGEVFYAGSSYEKYLERKNGNHNRADWAWRWSKDLFKFGYQNGFIVVKEKKDGSKRIYTKTYLNATIKKINGKYNVVITERKKAISSIELINNIYSNDNAKKELKNYSIAGTFDYPKPSTLIKKFLKSYYKKDAVILDFFAGTGTTGQAVLETNKEDGGTRRFILCTNNQNNICEDITYERIRKTIQGYEFKGKKDSILFEKSLKYKDLLAADKLLKKINAVEEKNTDNFTKIVKELSDGVLRIIGRDIIKDKVNGIPANLKYYRTSYIEKFSENEDYNVKEELLKHIVEMVQLERAIKINNNEYIILLKDDDADKIEQDKECLKKCKVIYISSQVLLTRSQELLFDELGIELIPIPEYYFDNELREVGEL